MTIRKQTLEEWFLTYQLEAIKKKHFFNPLHLDADVTRISELYRDRDEKVPFTAILIKGLALTAKTHPTINRMVFRTFYGTRVVDFDDIHVNVPIMAEYEGRRYLIATTIHHAADKSIREIRDEIRATRHKDLADTMVTKHFLSGRNSAFVRLKLRLIHFVVYNFPRLYVSKGGGGMSVSSLMNHDAPGLELRMVPRGPNAVTVTSTSSVTTPDGRTKLLLTIGWDHLSGHGDDIAAAMAQLAKNLAAADDELLEAYA